MEVWRTYLAGAFTLLLLAGGCLVGEDEEPPAGEARDASAQEDTAAGPSVSLATEVIAYTEGDFPHLAHAEVACSVCHADIRGHATHVSMACTECHTAPGAAAGGRPASAECNACHHTTDRVEECAHCHASPPAPVRAVPARFTIADRSPGQERPLLFDHVRHTALECRTCHTGGSSLVVERTCASCHTDHHRTDSDCGACHVSFPLSIHQASVHRGCTGAGCHSASNAIPTPLSRNACLVCHRDQVDHEPGGECRVCHLIAGTAP